MTIRELIKRYSDEKGIPHEVVGTIVMGMYKKTQEKRDSMDELHIKIGGLGTWNMKYWNLPKLKKWAEYRYQQWPTLNNRDNLDKVERALELKTEERRGHSEHWDKRRKWEKEQEQKEKDNINEQATATKGESTESVGE